MGGTPVFPGEPASIVLARQRRIRDSVHGLFNVSYKIRSAGGLGTLASSRPSTLRQARRLRRAALRSAHYTTSLLRSSLRSGTRRLFASYPLAPLRPRRLRRLLTVPQDGTEGENRGADEPSAAFVEEVSKCRPAFARLAAARTCYGTLRQADEGVVRRAFGTKGVRQGWLIAALSAGATAALRLRRLGHLHCRTSVRVWYRE